MIRELAALLMLAPCIDAAADSEQNNKVAWMLNCQGCHRADGGATGDAVPALSGTVAKFLSVPGGREYLIRVPGVAMAPMDDESIAELTNWMLREFDKENIPQDFNRYSADEVGALRKSPLGSEAGIVRAELIERMGNQNAPESDVNNANEHKKIN
ncbi:MAG: cytochrome C [Gammaproteobacteria bacterium]|nr:MAG: cytochrome C [Gammaproteobacteria bacterium]